MFPTPPLRFTRKSSRARLSYALLLTSLPLQSTLGFGLPEIVSTAVQHVPELPQLHLPSTLLSDATAAVSLDTSLPSSLYIAYKQALVSDPLPTKMMTGASLAILGDGIAQRCSATTGGDNNNNDEECLMYDSKRAVAFAAFDASYRAVQHVLYPPMVAFCQGQYLSAALGGILSATMANHHTTAILAAMEQSLVSQLVIIPFLYYPVFYAVTGAVQGLSLEETLERARETFVPLMQRNLLFWIPVQFAVFGFCEEPLQIPILTVCGLIWTFILSLVAGSVQTSSSTTTTENVGGGEVETVMEEVYDTYCVTGMEPHCLIDPDDLFHAPHHPATTVLESEAEKDDFLERNGDVMTSMPNTRASFSREDEKVLK